MGKAFIAIAVLALAGSASADTLTIQIGNRIDTHSGVVVQITQSNILARLDFGSTGYTSRTTKVQPPFGIGSWTVFVHGLVYHGCELAGTQYAAQHEMTLTFGCTEVSP